jgi:hypothetical protein
MGDDDGEEEEEEEKKKGECTQVLYRGQGTKTKDENEW